MTDPTPAAAGGANADLLRTCLDEAGEAIFALDEAGRELFRNRLLDAWLDEAGAATPTQLLRPADDGVDAGAADAASPGTLSRATEAVLRDGVTKRLEFTAATRDGGVRRVALALRRRTWGGRHAVLGTARDITAALETEATLSLFSRAIDQAVDSIIITDRNGAIVHVNAAFERTTGFTRAEALGQNPRIVRSGHHDEAFYARLWGTLVRGDIFHAILSNRRKDGSSYFEDKTIVPLRDASGRTTHYVSIGRDISASLREEWRRDFLAHHDPLTGLPNRNRFHEHLAGLLKDPSRPDGTVVVLILDLGDFRAINAEFGYEAGDRLLLAVAARLREYLGSEGLLARIGSDEFAILMGGSENLEVVARTVRGLLEALAQPVRLDHRQLRVAGSIGVALAPRDTIDAHELWQKADTAMHRAKRRGGGYCFYDDTLDAPVRQRTRLRAELAQALDRGEFALHYQPIVELATGRILGVEALLRWQHPVRGLIGPDEFITALEESGLIVPVGNWVLHSVCQQIRRWELLVPEPLRVSVNISARQFADDGLLTPGGCAGCIIQGGGLCAGITELEITESVFMRSDPATLATLESLRGQGIRLAIDDFGTGFSSLAYLTRFRVDTVKIDRSFVRDMLVTREATALVEAIVALAHTLGITVVAEGVETAAQLERLVELGCYAAQGYFFAKPLPADEVTEILLKQPFRPRGPSAFEER